MSTGGAIVPQWDTVRGVKIFQAFVAALPIPKAPISALVDATALISPELRIAFAMAVIAKIVGWGANTVAEGRHNA